MDFGYPQYTEAKILSEFIKTDAYRMEVAQRPPMAVTNAVSWRSEGIRYKKNEVSFLRYVASGAFLKHLIYIGFCWLPRCFLMLWRVSIYWSIVMAKLLGQMLSGH